MSEDFTYENFINETQVNDGKMIGINAQVIVERDDEGEETAFTYFYLRVLPMGVDEDGDYPHAPQVSIRFSGHPDGYADSMLFDQLFNGSAIQGIYRSSIENWARENGYADDPGYLARMDQMKREALDLIATSRTVDPDAIPEGITIDGQGWKAVQVEEDSED